MRRNRALSLALGLAPGGREHRRRTIDGGDAAGAPRKRDRQPSDAAAEFERRHRREFRYQPVLDQVQHPADVLLAAGEELALAFAVRFVRRYFGAVSTAK